MKIYLVYLTLLVFWLENSIGFSLAQYIGIAEGVSFRNINLFLLLVTWVLNIRKKRILYFDKVNIFLFLLCFILIISIPIKFLFYDVPDSSYAIELKSLKHWINPWIFFFLLYNIIDTKEQCRKSINALNVLLLLIVVTVMIELYGGLEQGTNETRWGRAAVFAEPNQFAAYLVLMMPLILSNFFLDKELKDKLKKGALIFFTILALVSTVSRGGYIAFFVTFVAFLSLSSTQRMISGVRIFAFVTLILSFAGIAYFVSPQNIKSMAEERVEISQKKRFEGDEVAEDRSWIWKYSSGRSEIWLTGIKLFMQSPVYGHGHDAHRTILNIKPHNSFLMYLLNYGLIGLTIFVMIFYFVFRRISVQFKTTTDDYSKKIYLSFLAGFIGYLVAMFGVDIYTPRYIFWIYVAIVYRYAILEGAESATA